MGTFFAICICIVVVIWVLKGASNKNHPDSDKQSFRERKTPLNTVYRSSNTSNRSEQSNVQQNFDYGKLWIPKNQRFQIDNYVINGGMIYVGSQPKINGYVYNLSRSYPTLIDPKLPIDSNNPDVNGTSLDYYPSYSGISAQARAAYLEWNASGRYNPRTPIGYIFLYYYGLERRALKDLAVDDPHNEIDDIINELMRLLQIYDKNQSFYSYSNNLIIYLLSKKKQYSRIALLPKKRTYLWNNGTYDLPIGFRIGLACFIVENQPIPAEWALDWVRFNPYSTLRTPASRCPEQLKQLFALRYSQEYNEGLVLKANKSMIKVEYRPASQELSMDNFTITTDLPDVGKLTSPLEKLKTIVEECIDELDSYSRYLGRNPESMNSLHALALLPKQLLNVLNCDVINNLRKYLFEHVPQNNLVLIPFFHFLENSGVQKIEKFNQQDTVQLAQLLEAIDFGIEPDVRFGGRTIKIDDSIVLFHQEADIISIASEEYSQALLLVQLSALVCLSDNSVSDAEWNFLYHTIDTFSKLSYNEQLRLKAHVKWFINSKPAINTILKRLEQIPLLERDKLTVYLVNTANQDNRIESAEIQLLSKIFKLLGFTDDHLHSLIHNLLASGKHNSLFEPVAIMTSSSTEDGYAIPLKKSEDFTLNQTAISQKKIETKNVSNLLQNIFQDDVPTVSSPIESSKIKHLDGTIGLFFDALITREVWERTELEDLALQFGLMLDGTLETINDLAYDIAERPLLEEDNNYIIDKEVLEEMRNGN